MSLFNKFSAEIPFFVLSRNAIWIAISNNFMQENIGQVVTLKIIDKDEILYKIELL